MRALICVLLLGCSGAWAAEHAELVNPMVYTGMAHASAGVPVSSNLFLVADDETNTLRLYSNEAGGAPLQQFDMDSFLEIEGRFREADLEGAARIGERAFWIGSHGRNRSGKERDNRCRFFATDIQLKDGNVVLSPVGQPCKRLLQDLLRDPRFEAFHFESASLLAPKTRGALNIEGLSATPEGHLLLGFRNPIPDGKALLIPLLNPNEVLGGASCKFGPPLLLDLHGLGIRDIAFYDGTYIIAAGPYHGGGPFRLYHWAGPGTEPKRIHTGSLGTFHAEAVIFYPQLGLREFQILSDDGRYEREEIDAVHPPPDTGSSFRSVWVKAEPKH